MCALLGNLHISFDDDVRFIKLLFYYDDTFQSLSPEKDRERERKEKKRVGSSELSMDVTNLTQWTHGLLFTPSVLILINTWHSGHMGCYLHLVYLF